MSNSINLITPQKEGLERRQRTVKILRIISISFLLATFLLSLILFIISSRLSISDIKKQENSASDSLGLVHNKFAKLILVKDRMDNIQIIIKQRKNYQNLINSILKVVPQDSSINSLGIEKDKITLIVSSPSLLSINKFLDDIVTFSKNKKVINNVIINSLTVDQGLGRYILSVGGDIPQ
jgi:hypothetical protein